MPPVNENDLMVLARTIYGEARGELDRNDGGLKSLQAIAWVVKNRMHQGRFGASVSDVCLQPRQFSCWNEDDPNRTHILNSTFENKILQVCFLTAAHVLFGDTADCTDGADHYHSARIKTPHWAKDAKPTKKIANHIFYKLG